MMLHLREQDLVPRPERPAEGLGDQADPVGRAACEDDLLAARRADEALDAVARRLVELGRLLTERMDRAVNVGVAPLVVLAHRLDHGARLLARGSRVEVDQRVTVDDPLEDREVRARPLVEPHGRRPPFKAIRNTESGRVTQRMRVGRISAWSTASRSAASSAEASCRDRPATSSARTSAAAAQIAHESPTKRAPVMRSPSSASIKRTRSPQSGLTSSATALAPGSSPRKRGRRQRSRMTSL